MAFTWSCLKFYYVVESLPFSKRQICYCSKQKKFADNHFKFEEVGRKFFKQVENNAGKGDSALRAMSPFHSVFKRLVLKTRKNQGLFGKGF